MADRTGAQPDILGHLTGLVVRPGDTLVVTCRQYLDRAQASEIGTRIRQAMPGLEDLLLIDGVDGFAVYRPHDVAAPAIAATETRRERLTRRVRDPGTGE